MEKEKTTISKMEMLDALMKNSPDCIYFKDLKGRFIRVSKALIERMNINNFDEVLGKDDFDFFTKEYATRAFHDEQNIIKTGVPFFHFRCYMFYLIKKLFLVLKLYHKLYHKICLDK